MRKIGAFIATMLMITVGMTFVTATTPEFNENHDLDTYVDNTPPVIIEGWIEILNQSGELVWSSIDSSLPRADSYIWESEKLIVYAKIHDDNGESDLWQHTVQAWLSPEDAFITDLAIDHFVDGTNNCEAVFKGEKFIPGPDVWQCLHDIYITDTDKYGACADNDELVIFDHLYINPMMSSTFENADGDDFVKWSLLHAGDEDIPADGNPYTEHVYAKCIDPDTGQAVPVTVNYELWIHGTDLEGGIGVAHVIPCENVEYSMDGGLTWISLTNGEVFLGEYLASQDIIFDFRITVPLNIEMGNYAGEVGFGIKAL